MSSKNSPQHPQWLLSELVRQDPVARGLVLGTSRYCLHLATNLHLPVNACASALYYLHRFYSVYKFGVTERKVVAGACVLLAWKVCEDASNVPTSVSTRKLSSLPRLMYRLQKTGGHSTEADGAEADDEQLNATAEIAAQQPLSPPGEQAVSSTGGAQHVEGCSSESASQWLLRTEGVEYTRMRKGLRIYETALLRALQYDTEVNLLPFQLLDTLCRKLSLTIPAKQCLHNVEMALLVKSPVVVRSTDEVGAQGRSMIASGRSGSGQGVPKVNTGGGTAAVSNVAANGDPSASACEAHSNNLSEGLHQHSIHAGGTARRPPSAAVGTNEHLPCTAKPTAEDEYVEFTFLRVVPECNTTGTNSQNCDRCSLSDQGQLDPSLVQHLFVLGVSVVLDFFQSPFCLDYTATEIAIATAWKCAVALGLPVVTGKLAGDGIPGSVPKFRCKRRELAPRHPTHKSPSISSSSSKRSSSPKTQSAQFTGASGSVGGGRLSTEADGGPEGDTGSANDVSMGTTAAVHGSALSGGAEGSSSSHHAEGPRCVCWEEIVDSCGAESSRIHLVLRDMRQVYTWLIELTRDWDHTGTAAADAAQFAEHLRRLRLRSLESVYKEAKRSRVVKKVGAPNAGAKC